MENLHLSLLAFVDKLEHERDHCAAEPDTLPPADVVMDRVSTALLQLLAGEFNAQDGIVLVQGNTPRPTSPRSPRPLIAPHSRAQENSPTKDSALDISSSPRSTNSAPEVPLVIEGNTESSDSISSPSSHRRNRVGSSTSLSPERAKKDKKRAGHSKKSSLNVSTGPSPASKRKRDTETEIQLEDVPSPRADDALSAPPTPREAQNLIMSITRALKSSPGSSSLRDSTGTKDDDSEQSGEKSARKAREIEFSMNEEASNYEVITDDIDNAPTSPHSESKGRLPALFCVHLGLNGNRKAFPYMTDKPLSEILETVCRTWGLNYDALTVTTMEGEQVEDFSITIPQLGGVTDIIISEIDVTGLSPENTERVLNQYLQSLAPPKLVVSVVDEHKPDEADPKIDIVDYAESVLSPLPAVDPNDEVAVRAQYEKRLFIAKEIAQTERNYTNDLAILLELFQPSLIAKNIVPQEAIEIIFPMSLRVIYKISESLAKKIEERLEEEPENIVLGDVFIRIAEFMKSYTSYVNNYEYARALVSDLRQNNPQFSQWIKEIEKNKRCNNHTLEDFLITVVQRLPRYVMLISDLLRRTPSDHVDHQYLTTALQKMKNVADYVNAEKRVFENREHAKRIYSEYGLDKDATSTRTLVTEEELYKQPVPASVSDKKALKERCQIHVFNDGIIMARYKKDELEGVKQVPYKLLDVAESDDPTSLKINGAVFFCASTAKRDKLLKELYKNKQQSPSDDSIKDRKESQSALGNMGRAMIGLVPTPRLPGAFFGRSNKEKSKDQ